MAVAIASSTRSTHNAGFFSRIAQELRAWRERRAAAAQLHDLDDRMLSDIGVTRSEIDRVVRDGVRRS